MKASNDNIKDLIQFGNLQDVERLIDERPELLDTPYNLDDQYSGQPYLGKGSNGYTPLLHATLLGKDDIVDFLLSKQADYSTKVYIGKNIHSVLDISIKEGHWRLSELLIRQGIIERTVYKVSEIASRNREVAQLLFTELAISRASMLTPDGIPNRLIDVLNQGLNVNLSFNEISTKYGDTILTYAARNGYLKSVEELITRFGYYVAIQKLVNRKKAWQIAKEAGHFSIVKTLFFSENNKQFLKQNLYNPDYLVELQEFISYVTLIAIDNDSINQFWELIITSLSEDSVIEVGNRKLLLFMQLVSNALNERQSLEDLQIIENIKSMLGLTEKFLVFHGITGKDKSSITQGIQLLNHQDDWSEDFTAQTETHLGSNNFQALARMVGEHDLTIKISEQHVLINERQLEILGDNLESKLSFTDKLLREISIQYTELRKFSTVFEYYTMLSNIAKWQLEVIKIDEERNSNSSKYFLVLRKVNIFRIGETRIYKIAPNLKITNSALTFPEDTNPVNNHFRKVLEITIEQQESLLRTLEDHQILNLDTIARVLRVSLGDTFALSINLQEWQQTELIEYYQLMERNENEEEQRFLNNFVLRKQQEFESSILEFKQSLIRIKADHSILSELVSKMLAEASELQTEVRETTGGLSYRVTDLENSKSIYKVELEQSLKQYCEKLVEGLKKFPEQNAAILKAIRGLEGSQQKLLEKFAKLQPLIATLEPIVANIPTLVNKVETLGQIVVRMHPLIDNSHIIEEIISNFRQEQEQECLREMLFTGDRAEYNKSFYHHFVQVLNAVYLASAVVRSGIVKDSGSGIYAEIKSIVSSLAPHIPIAGIAVQLCVSVLSRLESNSRNTVLNNFFNIVTSPNDIDDIAKNIAQKLLQAELDPNKFTENESFLDKLLGLIKLVLDNIDDIKETFKSINSGKIFSNIKQSIQKESSSNIISTTNSINVLQDPIKIQQTNDGKKHAELIVTLLISKIYNGDANEIRLILNNEIKTEYLLNMILAEYHSINEDAKNMANTIVEEVIKRGIRLQDDIENKNLKVKELKNILTKALEINRYGELSFEISELKELISNLLFSKLFGDSRVINESNEAVINSIMDSVLESSLQYSQRINIYNEAGIRVDVEDTEIDLEAVLAVKISSLVEGKTDSSGATSLNSPADLSLLSPTQLKLLSNRISNKILNELYSQFIGNDVIISETDLNKSDNNFIEKLSSRLITYYSELIRKIARSNSLENDFIEVLSERFKSTDKITFSSNKISLHRDLLKYETLKTLIDSSIEELIGRNGEYNDAIGERIIVAYIKDLHYSNLLLNHKELFYEATKINGKIVNDLIELGKDQELAEQILFVIDEIGVEKVLEIFFGNKIKPSDSESIQISEQELLAKTQEDEKLLETIAQIEAVIGKEALAELSGWHKYVSKALSNNHLSKHATTVIEVIGNLLNNLEEWLDFAVTYESIEIDNQVAVILSQLENMFDFVASGITYVGLPPRYPDFDPDDYYGGGSGGSGDNSNIREQSSINDIDFSLLFAGNNSTTMNDLSLKNYLT
jgi:hypothetical protein